MHNELTRTLNKFYHDLSISELKLQQSLQDSTKLTYNDVLYLDIISAYPGMYTSSKIADMLGVSRPSVTKKIKELVKKGYVTRRQSESDKRVHYLFVNDGLYTQYSGASIGTHVAKVIEGKYTENDIKNLCELLSLLSSSLLEENLDDLNR